MVNQSDEWNPILPYPSRASVGEAFVAIIEQSSGVVPSEDWGENNPYYLKADVQAICEEFRDEIEAALSDAQSSLGLLRNQSSYERQIAEDAVARADSKPESQHTLNTLRIVAIERCREEQRQRNKRTA